MENNTIFVRSASDSTIVVNTINPPVHRVWTKKGAKYPFDRQTMIQVYYDPSVEALFREGKLVTDDEAFLVEVGLKEEGKPSEIVELTDDYKNRLIKLMPLAEVKVAIQKLSQSQIDELVDYAITHYQILAMDRVDYFTKISGKNVMEAIRNYKLSLEV